MNYKNFFKPSKRKIILSFIFILIIPIQLNVPSFCDAIGGCGNKTIFSLPIINIAISFTNLLFPAFESYSLGFNLFLLDILGLFVFSSFWVNFIISYPLACLTIFLIQMKNKVK